MNEGTQEKNEWMFNVTPEITKVHELKEKTLLK